MRKSFMKLLLCSLMLLGMYTISQPIETVFAQKEIPPYAKWGSIAMQKVKQKYPNADIVDYLHVGRKKGNKNSTETFKLWLKGPDKEFGVFIDITFNNDTERIEDITYREVSS